MIIVHFLWGNLSMNSKPLKRDTCARELVRFQALTLWAAPLGLKMLADSKKWSQIWFNLILFRGVYELCIVLTSYDIRWQEMHKNSLALRAFAAVFHCLDEPRGSSLFFFLLGLVIQPFPSRERAKWEFWKIIESKVPAGIGYLRSQEGSHP